jgi:hypothetical protein
MKVLRELKSKKILKSVLKGSLKTNVFLILLGIFFSTLAFAAALTVTWLDGRIPQHNSSCQNSAGEYTMEKDSTEDPLDVAFSTDGLQVFTANWDMEDHPKPTPNQYGNLSMNRLLEPFDVSRSKRRILGDVDCDFIDSFRVGVLAGDDLNTRLRAMVVADEGRKFFFASSAGKIYRFDLSTPNEFKTATFVDSVIPNAELHNFAFSDDGKKLFTIRYTSNTPLVTTYQLPGPYDISSITQIHQVDLTDIGVTLPAGTNYGRDIEFSKSGHAMFVLIQNTAGNTTDTSDIYQFTLEKKFDVSTATLVGNYDVNNFGNKASGLGYPVGFVFSNDGMKVFIVDIAPPMNSVDQINSYQLECPYGLVACVSDPTASIGSQVELAKQNIALNISSIFYRFEWIKRNRDEENFTSHNININYPNPLLKSLAMSLEPVAKKKIATLVSTPKKDQKKSKWSLWSLADLSLSHFDKLGFENEKNIRNEGITLGADRKFSDNKFFGWAIRYGNGRSNIARSQQNIHMDSLTLNLYGIMPKDKENYLNAVLGLSALKIDSHYLGKKSGKRYGKQLFTAIDFRTKNTYGKLNLTPTTKFTFGITRLGEYTDFLSDAINSPTQNIRYDEDTFTTGQISSGFLFEADQITINDKTFQPMGGMEFYYDMSRDIDYNYSIVGSNQVNTDTIDGAYHRPNLRTSLGFELIYPDGLTLSPMYEKTFALKGSLNESKGITERFIIKISRSKEMDGNNFALDFDPLSQNYANISFNKNLGNLNLKLNSNYSLFDKIPDYGASLEISGTF